jgi:hypothetical protein
MQSGSVAQRLEQGTHNSTEAEGMYRQLRSHLVSPELRTHPRAQFIVVAGMGHPGFGCGETSRRRGSPVPATVTASSKLLRAYLAIDTKICGPPAIDREFSTIDSLTLLDLRALPAIIRAHFLR